MTMSTPITQILKLILITALLIITPLLSSSLRSTYLYLIANVLILLVGAEAGLLSFFLTSPATTKRPPSAALPKPHSIIQDKTEKPASQPCTQKSHEEEEQQKKMKKSPSMPSIFFIDQPAEDRNAEEVEGEEEEEIGGHELFQKAETFIGNFYKQLKMQREDSWKKLHDFYHKPF